MTEKTLKQKDEILDLLSEPEVSSQYLDLGEISGHFVLWLLEIMNGDQFINRLSLENYFKKYKKVLKKIANLT